MDYARDLANYYDPHGELRSYYQLNDDQFLDLVAQNVDSRSDFEDDDLEDETRPISGNISAM